MASAHGVEVDPGHVVIMPGGKATMFFAILMFGEPGAEIMYPDPGFPIYRSMIQWTGAKAVPIALQGGERVRLHRRRGAGADHAAHPAHHRQQPRQPDRRRGARRARSTRLVAGLEKHPHVAVLSDEIYSQMLYDGRTHASLLRYPADPRPADRARRLVEDLRHDRLAARLLGMAEGAGGAGDAAVRQHPFVRQRGDAVRRHRRAGRSAGRGAADGGGLRRAPPRHRADAEPASGLPCVNPGGAFYAFPNIAGTGMAARELQNQMLEKAGVATIAGTSFGIHGEGYIRFSYANSIGEHQAGHRADRDAAGGEVGRLHLLRLLAGQQDSYRHICLSLWQFFGRGGRTTHGSVPSPRSFIHAKHGSAMTEEKVRMRGRFWLRVYCCPSPRPSPRKNGEREKCDFARDQMRILCDRQCPVKGQRAPRFHQICAA